VNFNRSKGISEIIAIILVVVLTLVAFGVAYAFVFSTLGRSSSGTSVNIQGQLTAAGSGVLNFYNTGSVALSAGSSANVAFAPASGSCASVTSPAVTTGSSSYVTFSCSGINAGTTVTVTATLTFANNAVTTDIISVVAS
jgi:flagellar basal body-associated protein FliL